MSDRAARGGDGAGGRRHSTRAGVLAIGVVALLLLTALPGVHRFVADLIARAEPVVAGHPVLGGAVFAALALLSSMLVFVSSVLLVPVGIAVWGRLVTLTLLWGAWFLGGLVTYSIGRHLGRPAVRWFVSEEKLLSYEARIPREGAFFTALAIQLSVPSDIAGYVFGLVRFPRRTYLAALAVAELPYAVGSVYLGEAFLARNTTLLIVVAVLAAALAYWQWKRGGGRGAGAGELRGS